MSALVDLPLLDLELVHRGKVRDVYAVDDRHLLLVASDTTREVEVLDASAG